MNNLLAALGERIVAVWIERIWGSKITTIAGILGVTGTCVAQYTTFVPAEYAPIVTMAGVLLAGVAAILARDAAAVPAAGSSSTSATQKTGAIALVLLVLLVSVPTVGCNGTTVAQDIVNWTPMLQSAVATVDTSAALLAPADAPIFAAATVGFDVASNVLVAQAKAYLANPNATVLAQLQTAVVTFQQQVNTALLQAVKIVDAKSQQHAVTSINAVATAVNAMLALVESVSSKTAIAQMSAASTVKLAEVEQYLDKQEAARLLAAHYGEPVSAARIQVDEADLHLAQAGF